MPSKRRLFTSLFALALVLLTAAAHAATTPAPAPAPADSAPAIATVAGEPLVNVEFNCKIAMSSDRSLPGADAAAAKASPTPCAYRLYVQRCHSTGHGNDQACQVSTLTTFDLGPDEKKSLTGVPAAYRACIGPGKTPTITECMAMSPPPPP